MGSNNIKVKTPDENSDFYIDYKLKKIISKSRFSINSSTKLISGNKLPLQSLDSTDISDITFINSENDINSLREICQIFE